MNSNHLPRMKYDLPSTLKKLYELMHECLWVYGSACMHTFIYMQWTTLSTKAMNLKITLQSQFSLEQLIFWQLKIWNYRKGKSVAAVSTRDKTKWKFKKLAWLNRINITYQKNIYRALAKTTAYLII